MSQDILVQQVFPFWKAIEALTPQKVDKDDPDDKQNPAYHITRDGTLPWLDPKHCRKRLPPGKVWRYSVQYGVYGLAQFASLLEDKIGRHEEVFDDRLSGKSRLFDIRFDELGLPQYESFTLSLPVWAAGQILRHEDGIASLENSIPADLTGLPAPSDLIPAVDSGFTDFDVLTRHLMQWVSDEAIRLQREHSCANLAWLEQLAELVCTRTGFPQSARDPRHVCLVKCFQVKAPQASKEIEASNLDKAPEATDDLLNSFFIQELRGLNAAWRRQDVGRGFVEYITAVEEAKHPRLDIRSEQGLKTAFDCLLPTQAPAGCWPSQHPLAFSQQLAVNEIWRHCSTEPGIFAVNGPPGTGKTTLLRDVVAAVITQRAQLLVSKGRDALGAKTTFKFGDKRIPYHPLHQGIQGFAIVVASANNGAVENISLELPGIKAVPETVAKQSDYFSGLAAELIDKPAWGLLAARLGNKTNRDAFMNIFWWRKPKEKEVDGSLPPQYFNPERGEGLQYHLNLIKDGKRTPVMQWADAAQRFRTAQRAETEIREKLVRASGLSKQLAALKRRIVEVDAALDAYATQLEKVRRARDQHADELLQAESVCRELREQFDAAEQRLVQHQSHKPGLLAWISTFGRSHRQWWDRQHLLTAEQDAARHKLSSPFRALQEQKVKQTELQSQVAELERNVPPLEVERSKLDKQWRVLSQQLEQAQSSLGSFWPNPSTSDDEREKSSPWAQKEWREAREALFLAALDVHRAFIENHPQEILPNLNLASDWLQGKDLPAEVATTALDSLCLVVPVISTTFASIPRMFRSIGKEAIGWLLIDEAGQALPQQAAGAIWRAARTVVVGDPKQLEPVSGIPPIVEGALAKHYRVAPPWWPSETSAQVLADQTMSLGTYLPDPGKGTVWVGCPLRVHRRCDNPMFTISNQIAYDGLMVHGKNASQTALPKSCWIDVSGKNSEGNWIPEEGEIVQALLLELRDNYGIQPADVFLISPFRDCANRLSRLAGQLGFLTEKTGTVHTTQGKEADVVVLVLGGNPQKPGAKSWAASRPNLLNVAVSRAKQRLYVVGDRRSWQKQAYFSTLSQALPDSGSVLSDLVPRVETRA
ncbi:DEAD/DEAH box helicase [Chromobacterium violaceum]|uniref:DEAD/DEAH box helicase n=1 Tax=Chromobacterium violaceum TaxID=536 RepID=UPI0005D364B6|nr:AAA domain-containing protein [Chromobacterium violaceum]